MFKMLVKDKVEKMKKEEVIVILSKCFPDVEIYTSLDGNSFGGFDGIDMFDLTETRMIIHKYGKTIQYDDNFIKDFSEFFDIKPLELVGGITLGEWIQRITEELNRMGYYDSGFIEKTASQLWESAKNVNNVSLDSLLQERLGTLSEEYVTYLTQK